MSYIENIYVCLAAPLFIAAVCMHGRKTEGAEGYDIFFARCKKNGKEQAFKKIKTIEGNKTFTLNKGDLKSGVSYKMYVKAFVKENGKKKYVYESPHMHAKEFFS